MGDAMTTSARLSDGEADLRLEATVASVNWNVLASVTCLIHGATTSQWGDQVSGGYNVVRFLHLGSSTLYLLPPGMLYNSGKVIPIGYKPHSHK